MQTAKKLLMVRPANFAYNTQTSDNNYFQHSTDQTTVNAQAIEEFDRYVQMLRNSQMEVVVIQDTIEPHTPDSIFPNNWFSTHPTGELVLYPMYASNRREERKEAALNYLTIEYRPSRVVDLTHWESKNEFLEGTGSMILDHNRKIVYACRSLRTSENVLNDFCEQMNFDYVLFDALDKIGNPIYHTNVMMSLGENIAIICTESIPTMYEREIVISSLRASGKEIIEISQAQINRFAGNILEVRNLKNESLMIMSQSAKNAFTHIQLEQIKSHCTVVAPSIDIIESNGGGSARCMIAEIFEKNR